MVVLMPHCGFLSETTRMLAIGQALVARGQPVVFATHGGPYAHVIEDAGFPLTRLGPPMDDARCAQFLRDLVQLGRPGVRLQPADEVRESVRAEVDFFRRSGARMAVIGFTLTAYLSARVAGIPLAASHGGSYVPPVFEQGLAPVPTTMPMPGVEWLPAFVKRAMANGGAQRMKGPVAFLNQVAAELGVEPVPTLAALMLGDLTLVTDVPEVLGVSREAMESWRPPPGGAYRAGTRLTYVGPMYARLGLPVPPAVAPFLDGSRPTALVVLSSSTPAFLHQVVQQVRRAGLRVIVGATVHEWLAPPDPDVVVAGVLPSHEIMPRVDLAVTMGGQGSILITPEGQRHVPSIKVTPVDTTGAGDGFVAGVPAVWIMSFLFVIHGTLGMNQQILVGSGRGSWVPIDAVIAMLAGSLAYAGGTTLNDVFDAGFDRKHRPERSIPRGLIARSTAGWVGGLQLAAGLALFVFLGASPLTTPPTPEFNDFAARYDAAFSGLPLVTPPPVPKCAGSEGGPSSPIEVHTGKLAMKLLVVAPLVSLVEVT